jgi:hypothetical protein
VVKPDSRRTQRSALDVTAPRFLGLCQTKLHINSEKPSTQEGSGVEASAHLRCASGDTLTQLALAVETWVGQTELDWRDAGAKFADLLFGMFAAIHKEL